MNRSLLILLIFNTSFCFSQLYIKSDSLNKSRLIGSSVLVASAWTSSFIGLSKIWYEDFEKSKFHFFDDSKNWMQMDKIGHSYSTYHFSQQLSKTYRWAGMDPKKSAIIGSSISFAYLLSIEFLDGRSTNWGFSWSDVLANSMGSTLYLTQELVYEQQVFKLKFSYFPSKFAAYRPEVLGSTFPEKLLKDYNAQNYWLTFSPVFFLKNSKFPKYINLAIGYSVNQKLLGDKDVFVSSDGLTTFNAERQFLLSLDLDIKALKIKKQWLKSLLAPFNSIKVPFPTLILSKNSLSGKLYL